MESHHPCRQTVPSVARRATTLAGALALAAAVLMAGPLTPNADAAEATTVTGGDGRTLAINDTSRVVSIGGAITEIIYALDAEKKLVAVDTTSRYPAAALKTLPNVGYLRQLSAEGILSLRPTLVLAMSDSGPLPQIKLLRAANVPLVILAKDPTPAGVVAKIKLIGAALGRSALADQLSAAFRRDMAALSAAIDAAKRKPRVLFLLSVGRGAPLAAGGKTAADGIIRLAGGMNAVTGYDLYKPLTPEGAVTARPDVILVTHRTVGLLGGRNNILGRTEIRSTPAGRNRKLIAMDGLYLLGFGPRTPAVVRELARRLHPKLALPKIETAEAVRKR